MGKTILKMVKTIIFYKNLFKNTSISVFHTYRLLTIAKNNIKFYWKVIVMYVDFKLLGKRIAKRRHDLGIKQNVLAEKAGISNNYLSNIENGKSIPSLETFVILCLKLKTSPDYFLLGTMKTDDIPNNIIEKLKLCDKEQLDFICDLVDLLLSRKNR